MGGGLGVREGGGELWGDDFGVKSKVGGLDWNVESEMAEDEVENLLTFNWEDEKADVSTGGFGGPWERVWGIHCKTDNKQ